MTDRHILTLDDIHFCKWLGEARYKDKKDYSSYRPLSDNFAMVGVAGELLFSLKTGYAVNTDITPWGDGGIDFDTPLGTIDIKTLRRASQSGLLVEEGKVRAFLYVLAEFWDEPPSVKLLGFAEACSVRNHPARRGSRDIINHRVPIETLEPMDKLYQWLKDIDPGPGKGILEMTNKEFHRRCWAIQARAWWGSLTPPPDRTLQEIWRAAGLLDEDDGKPVLGR